MTEEQTKNAIENLVSEYLTEEEKFTGGNMSAGTRARKLLSEITKFAKQRRSEIQEIKNNK
jgi:hypothetical protein